MKKRTSVYVDTKLLELAKRNGLNLSKLLESAILEATNRKSNKLTEDLRPCPVGVRGFESRPPHRSELESKLDDFIFKLKLTHISEQEIKAYKSDLRDFLTSCSYQLDNNNILIYINKLKDKHKPKTLRNKLIRIRRFLKFINHPLANQIELPRIPKQRKNVIKLENIRDLLIQVEKLPYPYNLSLKSAILLSATSGLRAEELYKLEKTDLNLETRTVVVKAEKAKDYEERITFFQ